MMRRNLLNSPAIILQAIELKSRTDIQKHILRIWNILLLHHIKGKSKVLSCLSTQRSHKVRSFFNLLLLEQLVKRNISHGYNDEVKDVEVSDREIKMLLGWVLWDSWEELFDVLEAPEGGLEFL